MSSSRGSGTTAVVRTLSFAPLLALLATFVLWHALRFSPRTALLVSLLAALPWLPLLRGLWRARRNAQALGLLLTTPYLGYGLMEVLANPGSRAFAGSTVLLAFVAAAAFAACLRLSPVAAAAPRGRTAP